MNETYQMDLDDLITFQSNNYLRAYFNEYLPQFSVATLEGTYLAWVDCRLLKKSSNEIVTTLMKKDKVWINEGSR